MYEDGESEYTIIPVTEIKPVKRHHEGKRPKNWKHTNKLPEPMPNCSASSIGAPRIAPE